jgi:hypothetical protein
MYRRRSKMVGRSSQAPMCLVADCYLMCYVRCCALLHVHSATIDTEQPDESGRYALVPDRWLSVFVCLFYPTQEV